MSLTNRQLEKMRMLYESGESVSVIEQRLKVSAKTIYTQINKHGWERRGVTLLEPESENKELSKKAAPYDLVRSKHLDKVLHIENLTSMLLSSMGNSPEELADLDDTSLNRIIKGMKALKMAAEISDINLNGVRKSFGVDDKDADGPAILPIHIELSTSEKSTSD